MRVAIVAESFLPTVNGVVNSVLRVLEHLKAQGHEAIVIAPGAREFQEEIPDYLGFTILRVPTIRVPLVNSLPIGVPTGIVNEALRDFHPDIVHLASPFVLGAAGAFAARLNRTPAVAVYQTDIAGYTTRYHLSALYRAAWDWTRTIHNTCQLTLAPSSATIATLRQHNITNVHRWGRGVDATLFHPSKRSPALRAQWNPTGDNTIVGYVGRLAAEKGLPRLAVLNDRPDIQLVIVGGGPERMELEELLPGAIFTGPLSGEELAAHYASFDVFVHPGEFETFCQTIQEAQASGVPTIAPRAGGPVDLIVDGYNGYLLDVASFRDDLHHAVDSCTDNSRYQRLRGNARASIADKTWECLCTQLMGYYQQAIDSFYTPVPRLRRSPVKYAGRHVKNRVG